MNLDEIRELITLMKENQIAEIDLEHEGERLRVVSALVPATGDLGLVNAAGQPPARIPAPEVPELVPEVEAAADDNTVTVNSPIVGTFYRAPAPDEPAFVEEGDEFDEETVLCIVEAMKVMNEIKAELKGKIIELLVENGQPVEFGQPLFRVAPAT